MTRDGLYLSKGFLFYFYYFNLFFFFSHQNQTQNKTKQNKTKQNKTKQNKKRSTSEKNSSLLSTPPQASLTPSLISKQEQERTTNGHNIILFYLKLGRFNLSLRLCLTLRLFFFFCFLFSLYVKLYNTNCL